MPSGLQNSHSATKYSVLLAVCLAYFALSSSGDTLRGRMDAYVRRYADADLLSGVVRVTKGDRVVYESAFGQADRGLRVPNTLQTKFHVASLSKPITATAVLLLMEEGKLGLNDPLTKFVPDFPNGDNITIEELLSHYSGLGDASAQSDYAEWSRFPQTTAALVNRAKKVLRQSEPGTAYFYSNSNITFWRSSSSRCPEKTTEIFSIKEFSSRRE